MVGAVSVRDARHNSDSRFHLPSGLRTRFRLGYFKRSRAISNCPRHNEAQTKVSGDLIGPQDRLVTESGIISHHQVRQIEARLRQQSQADAAERHRPAQRAADRVRNASPIAADVNEGRHHYPNQNQRHHDRQNAPSSESARNQRRLGFPGWHDTHQRTTFSIRDQRVWSKKWKTICTRNPTRSAMLSFLYWLAGVWKDQ